MQEVLIKTTLLSLNDAKGEWKPVTLAVDVKKPQS
jgi:hypothetical protein